MTPTQLASYVRYLTKTDSVTLTDAELLLLTNIEKDNLALKVVKADEDYFSTPFTTSLVANQREYGMSDDLMGRIKAVEAKLNGTDWIKLSKIDRSQLDHATDETTITNHFTNTEGEAFYDVTRNGIYIYSGTITAVTDGLKIHGPAWPADLTTMVSTTDLSVDPSTTTHGFPRQLHMPLALRVSKAYKSSKENPIPLSEGELILDKTEQDAIDELTGFAEGGATVAVVTADDGQDY